MRYPGYASNQFVFFIFAILCVLHSDAYPQSAESSDEEYRVYDAVIAAKFGESGTDFGSLSDGRFLVIREEVENGDPRDWQYIKEQLSPSEEAISNYRAVSSKAGKLGRKFSTKSEYALLSQKVWESIFKRDGRYDYEASWKNYYEKYPKSRGYIAFSRVGFNKEQSQAFLYFEHSCGSLCASGYYITARKAEGGWKVQKIVMVWIS